jgi:ABC-type nitrate/sulfonate/bicarbonate transport system substrate-binding protein
MKMSRRLLTFHFSAIVPLFALAGIRFESAATPGLVTSGTAIAAEDLPVIRWGVFKNFQPVFVAVEQGFFDQEGIRVEFTGNFTSGPAVVQAAGTGNVDAGHSATSGIVNAVNAGVSVIGVADSQTEFLDAPLMQWFVLADSPIDDPVDLRGKKVGVNSLSGSFYYTLLVYLQKNGLDKEDVQFVVIPHNNQEQALRSRQIEVAGLIDPYSMHIQREGGVRTLFRAVDVLGEVQFSLVFFRKEFVEKHPEAVKRFVRAYVHAIEFIVIHPEESSEIMAKHTGVTAELIGTHRYTPNAEVRMQDVQFWIDMMRQGNELNDGGKLRPEDVATNDFTPKR